MIGKSDIEKFYAAKKIAVVGASGSKAKYGHLLFTELKKRGYEVIPVNPNVKEIDGVQCFPSVRDIKETVEAAIVVVPPSQLEIVAKDIAAAGIKQVWMHEHIMKGVSSPMALAVVANSGATLITGFCPFMFMPNNGFPHNMHRAILGLFGALPK